ncbi:MAG: hypothetical protein ABI792_00030 [bacterium]
MNRKILPAIFRNNSRQNNILVILIFAAFIIIAVDLGSEMAREKDEIGTVIGIFEESYSNLVLSSDILSDIERPLLFEISLINSSPLKNICQSSVNDRGPPLS